MKASATAPIIERKRPVIARKRRGLNFSFVPESQFPPAWYIMLGIWHAVNPNAKWLLG
jgi:hypothetical protein